VELLRRYSNRDDLLKHLVSVLERVNEELPASHEEPQLASADAPSPQAWRVSDRLSLTDIKILVDSYLAGSTLRDLAEQYGISTTSVKRCFVRRVHGSCGERPSAGCRVGCRRPGGRAERRSAGRSGAAPRCGQVGAHTRPTTASGRPGTVLERSAAGKASSVYPGRGCWWSVAIPPLQYSSC
jgi:hypothetical protein